MAIKITKPAEKVEPSSVVISPEMIRDALLSLPDAERAFIVSDNKDGDHKIYSIRRNAAGNIEYDYEK